MCLLDGCEVLVCLFEVLLMLVVGECLWVVVLDICVGFWFD